jgi:PHD/YefM family antitoxin component YafN of YafNO toxin-antitoxin module
VLRTECPTVKGAAEPRRLGTPRSVVTLGCVASVRLVSGTGRPRRLYRSLVAMRLGVYALVYALWVAVPVVMSFREFRAGLAGVLDRVRQSPADVVYVGSHRRAEAVLVSVEQYEALLETSERQHAVAAALASVRAEGLEPGADDLGLFVQVAAGELTTDELRKRILSRYQAHAQR